MEHLNPQAIFIVITVFILFVNKVVDMMRAKQAERAAREERQARRADGPPRPPLHQPAPPRQQAPQQVKPASPFQDVLAELFEAAGVPTNSQPKKPPAVASQTPPPIPAITRSPAPALTKAEREALDRLELRNERSLVNRQRHHREATEKITQLLLSRTTARQAVVLAEILGPPRGIQEMDQRQ
ncbi:MAG: hypothetical protein R3F19_33685 [Verrucomicrobiales bacterium]